MPARSTWPLRLLLALVLLAVPYLRMATVHAQTPTAVGICMSNLKQIGQALRMYALDHDGVLPMANQGDAGKAHWRVTNKWGEHYIFLPDVLGSYLKDESTFDCPVRKGVGRDDAAGDYGFLCAHDPESTLAKVVSASGVSPQQCMACGAALSSCQHPAEKTMAFCNSLGVHTNASDFDVVLGRQGGTPVVFVDGSVHYLTGGLTDLARAALAPK